MIIGLLIVSRTAVTEKEAPQLAVAHLYVFVKCARVHQTNEHEQQTVGDKKQGEAILI